MKRATGSTTRRAQAETLRALHQLLAEAARDRFAGAGPEIGPSFRSELDRLLTSPPPGLDGLAPLAELRRAVDAFERAPQATREVLVARGLRLLRTFAPEPTTARAGKSRRPPATPAQSPSSVPAESAPARAPAPDLSELRSLPGVGPKVAASLAEAGILRIHDLVELLPRSYDDLRTISTVAEALRAPEDTRITVRARVTAARLVPARKRFLELTLEDDATPVPAAGEPSDSPPARLVARWFNVFPGMVRRFVRGDRVVVSGRLRRHQGRPGVVNPDIAQDGGLVSPFGGGIRPRYPDVPGVRPGILRAAVHAAVERYLASAAPEEDVLPEAVRGRLRIPSLHDALRALHLPAGDLPPAELAALDGHRTAAHRRFAVASLFLLQLAVLRRRGRARSATAPSCPASPAALARIRAALPFPLTRAQERALAEIAADLATAVPMQRLLQGDVGSGKTAVAFAASALIGLSGRQAALMAPTELLAEQHYRTIAPWCAALGLRVALLTAATPRGVRETTLALLGAGQLDVVVGTHALIAERVAFSDLALAIVDEQHRFGVAQRARLRQKGGAADGGAPATVPHLLVMTATPIPRTLALTAYGDLDLTLLDELPPGRRPPATRLFLGASGRSQAYRTLRETLRAQGGRAFVVCPLVDGSDKVEAADAVHTAAWLAEQAPELRVGLVHGRLASEERDRAMARFREGALDVLVATTVIEVGVDVPDATIMLVEHADRFGLAQLHQLRGRVGRGGAAGLCLLTSAAARGSDAARRLEVLAGTTDGFEVAEADLRERGAGELLGTRQAGVDRLRLGDLALQAALIATARAEAEAVLAGDPELRATEHAAARRALEARYVDVVAYGEEAG